MLKRIFLAIAYLGDVVLKSKTSCSLVLIALSLTFNTMRTVADDFVWGEDFKEGDTISAETFNQIFDRLEQLNRTVIDSDLIGSWTCDAMTTRQTAGYAAKESFYILEGAQVNFSASSASTSYESSYSVSTSSPSPFKRENASFNGTYQLYKNMLFLKQTGDSNARIYSVDIVSPTRIEFIFQETSATSFPANYSSFVTCDSTAVTPAAPSAPRVTQNGVGITFGWTDNSSDETGFRIYRRLSTEDSSSLLATSTTNTYYDTDVVEGSTYYYSVSAFSADAESAKSNTVVATLDATAPVVVSTSPDGQSETAIDDRVLSVTFSEKIEVFCPDGDEFTMMDCPTSNGAIQGTIQVDGSTRSLNIGQVSNGFGGSLTISGSMLGSAELLDANQTVNVTVDADWIRDVNGFQMTTDYTFSFEVGSTQNNPDCPPQC